MQNGIILAVVVGIGAVSAIVTILGARSVLPERRFWRLFGAMVLVVIGVGVAIVAYRHDQPPPKVIEHVPPPDPKPPVGPSGASGGAGDHTATEPLVKTAISVLPTPVPRIRIVTGAGTDDAALNGIAEQAACAGCSVHGVL